MFCKPSICIHWNVVPLVWSHEDLVNDPSHHMSPLGSTGEHNRTSPLHLSLDLSLLWSHAKVVVLDAGVDPFSVPPPGVGSSVPLLAPLLWC